MNKLIDLNFGINPQARAVMQMLDNIDPDFADYEDGHYKVVFKTRPWYNGRESGFVVSMAADYNKPYIHIAVFEHRNSDNICALKWETKSSYFNLPLEDPNIFNVAYGGKNKGKFDVAASVSCGECGKMADWVYAELEKFYKKTKEVPCRPKN